MSDKLVFKIVVEQGGKQVYSKSLGYEEVSNFVSSARDAKENHALFSLAAQHPSSVVRENIAYKDNLDEETVKVLLMDKSVNVLRNLSRTETFRKCATVEDIQRLIDMDIEMAQNVANYFESYEQVDSSDICRMLMATDDPSISYTLADNYNTPKKILKELVKHNDSHVANEAKRRLEE